MSVSTAAHANDAGSFDFVIVGAGSAGCVLANRLSADPDVTVCLLEAGPRDRSPLIHIPLALPALFKHPQLTWGMSTVPQPHAGNRSIYVPRGKVLGGSSAINGMVYQRGHPSDYDDWAKAGNAGWSFNDVLPYFLKSENNETWRNSPLHGISGPLHVTDLKTRSRTVDRFIAAGVSVGFRHCEDFNALDPEGFGYRQVTQRNGRRETVATAYLTPVKRRKNLCVITGAMIDRIEFDSHRASTVTFVMGNTQRRVRARREILLAAGVYGSPPILQRSGVGDGVQLQRLGIDVVKHLPGVGANLQDHSAVALSYDTINTEPYGISLRAAPRLAWDGIRYLLFRSGMVSSNILEGNAFVRSDPSLERPDIQFSFMPARRNPSRSIGFGHGYGMSTVVLRPKSRGSVQLASKAADALPLIDLGLFSNEQDMELMLRGLKLARRILNAPAFADYEGRESLPGANVTDDDALVDFIRKNSGTTFHPVGTCAMGRGPDHVVDARLLVRGIEGLRVVDASVMPNIIGGNTNGPTVMIAEKAADLILRER